MTDSSDSVSPEPRVTFPAIALLGAGSMGRAILSGLSTPQVRVDGAVAVTARSERALAQVSRFPGLVTMATETDAAANRRAVEGAHIVVVAVKPALVPGLLRDIARALLPGSVVVSVAAGVTIASMEAELPETVAVVRAMPNTPALVGKAVTGVSAGSRSTSEQGAMIRALFETVGTVVEVPESQIDALSTISGSGPAYVFALIEALTSAACEKGFSPEVARTLVNHTFLGAAQLLVTSGEDPAELRRRVTSPGGTTERALHVLSQADLPALFGRATDAALARARELAQPTGSR